MSSTNLSWLGSLCRLKFFRNSDLRKTSLNRKRSNAPKITIIEPEISTILLKQESTASRKSDLPEHQVEPFTPAKKEVEKPPVTEKDFRIMQVLRAGKNWRIYMVRKDNDEDHVYAMKLIGKKKMAKNCYEEQVAMEKEILEKAKFPFIPKLEWYFENEKKIFFVMEFVEGGGSLNNILKQLNRFSEEITRFYSAEILLTLEYLHTELKVAYNDVKLKNFLIDPQGHIKVLDYSQAKKIANHDPSKDHAQSGSPTQEKEATHEEMIDFWGFGCLIYELLTGRKPFTEGMEEEHVEMEDISPVSHLAWPTPVSKNAKDLITRLLSLDTDDRLGFNGFEEIKKHAFFSQVNWEKMLNKSVYPPLDPSQFNNEENIDEDADDDELNVNRVKYLNPSSLGKIMEGSFLNSDEGIDAVSFDRTTNLSSALGYH